MSERDFEAQYRALFDYAPDGILIADDQSFYLDANPAMCRMLGYSREELIGKHATDIVVPEEVRYIDPALETIKNTADYNREWQFRRKDRSTFAAEVMATIMPDGHIMAMVRDVTARKEAGLVLREREAQLRIASRVAKLGAWTVDLDTGRIKWSDELCEMRGVPPGTSPTQEQALETYAPEFREMIQAKAKLCATAGAPFDVELQMLGSGERKTWVRVIGHPERDAQGKVVKLHGAFQDIDERHRLEERVHQGQKMDAIGQLAGGVAHDFNNLLSIILSYTSMLINDLREGDPIRADLEQIRHAGERASQLTRQLLAFGRKQMLKPQVLDLGQVVLGMEKMLRRLLGEDIELSLLLSRSLGKVLADASQMEQVIMNLAVNARDAMPRGGKLSIETANVEIDASYAETRHDVDPGIYVMLAITDTGAGMDVETRQRAFEPFFTTKDKGNGLGLSTVFGIVKQSRGHIWVYSEQGRGTTFKVFLARTDERAPALSSKASVPSTMHGSETILLVEDEDAVRTVTCSILRRQGYNVLEAQNGGEAFLVCEKYPGTIHLLITDVVMPRMSGRELAERVSPLRPTMRVMYVSGYTQTAIVHHGVLDSGIHFLQKPITPDALSAKVREVLDASAT
jgi:two-component system cell cycle sensor histidine kinase/response regulator CckA